MLFFLGTHRPNWLGLVDVPLFVSHRRLRDIKTLPHAIGEWALDSGAFSEIAEFGRWTITPSQYVAHVRRYMDDVGNMRWAAPMDWMCEPAMIAKTGLDVAEHQRRTVDNYVTLRSLAPDIPFVPVLQGWHVDDYRRCWDRYDAVGINLREHEIVGVGSVCRRQHTDEIERVFEALQPLRLHGFGVKTRGLSSYGDLLGSADSMSWSYAARMNKPLPGHEVRHKNCANCLDYALLWRVQLLAGLDVWKQVKMRWVP